jgi:hypothetical protein
MIGFFNLLVSDVAVPFKSKARLEAGILNLRHQFNVLRRSAGQRPRPTGRAGGQPPAGPLRQSGSRQSPRARGARAYFLAWRQFPRARCEPPPEEVHHDRRLIAKWRRLDKVAGDLEEAGKDYGVL